MPARSPASSTTRSATSCGVVKRPVGACPACCSAMFCGSPPCAAATVAATPWSPSQSSVETGPGLTVLTRMPRGPTSFDSDLEKFGERGLGGAVVDHGRVRQEGVDRAGGDDRARARLEHPRQRGAGRAHGGHEAERERLHPLVVGDREESVERGVTAPTLLTSTSRGPSASAEATSSAGPSAVERSTLTGRTWPPSISRRARR